MIRDDRIDLHVHSTASDGSFSPKEILYEALRIGLGAISITDHDTIKGSELALKAGIPDGLGFITGVEVSVSPPSEYNINGCLHILGYGIDIKDKDLSFFLEGLRKSRIERVHILINRLQTLGINISKEEIFIEAAGSVIGRPHFANVMLKRGFVRSFREAFDRFLGKGKSAYIRKKKTDIGKILNLIKNAGGVSVLAHPHLIGIKDPVMFEKFIVKLKSMGLIGIEAIYPEHSKELCSFYSKVARLNGLLVTGGTDFHGSNSSGIKLGIGKGDFYVPVSLYKNLLKSIAGSF